MLTMNAGFLFTLVNERNVYSFTNWVALHPGGPDKIINAAENGSAVLNFPGHHEMWRWDNHKDTLSFLGVHNRAAAFRDFPSTMQTDTVKEFLGVFSSSGKTKVVVCGSPNEVANDISKGDTGLTLTLRNEIDGLWGHEYFYQKDGVWLDIVQTSPAQLRLRVAWALSQIFAISQQSTEEGKNTETYMYYYDIFVRQAFANYFDILKETSYNGLMAKMLTFLRSQSTAYIFEKEGSIKYADENFAREILQLFSIGLVMLDIDGTPILDENGNEILTYTNDHIMGYARAWTGFYVQGQRGNIERNYYTDNTIDPMKIIPEWRDVFPKLNLVNGFIGDTYPLCDDLPPKHHMRKGATYRLLGGSTQLEMQRNKPDWWELQFPLKIINLDSRSPLYKKLCNSSNGAGGCNFKSQITLDENLECFGKECEVDTLRLLEVGDGVYFEYIRQPCVELSFFNDARTLTYSFGQHQACGNPRLQSGGAACCHSDHPWTAQNTPCQYSAERVNFATASDRCATLGMEICEYTAVSANEESPECFDSQWHHFWHGSKCFIKLKVANDGKVAIVHEPQLNTHIGDSGEAQEEKITHKLQQNTPNFFQINWSECNYPTVDDNCNDGACEVVNEYCVCHTHVEEEQVFFSAPNSVKDVLESLFVGSVSPDTFDGGVYSNPVTVGSGSLKVYFRSGTSQSYDMDTIFEVEHLSKIYYFKNVKSVVHVIDPEGRETPHKFRNPPHFVSFHESDARDAYYETDAVLESYFYHQNTAPFLAIHFIQRFGTSNPSPRYVKVVATAFKNGIYEYETSSGSVLQYGSGKYGDMAALIASVLFDREARSLVKDLDSSSGSLKEPLLKVTNVFRSMEYEPFQGYKLTRYGRMISNDITNKIGQMAFDMKSIFSFFRRDFIPNTGPVGQASLVSPESQRYMTPTVLGTLNGLFSLIKFGLMECFSGFGPWIEFNDRCWLETEFTSDYSAGRLSFEPQNSHTRTEEIVDELATLLTAGRLNDESRKMIKDHFESAANDGYGLRLAQQLIVSTPEFHSTNNILKFSGEKRPPSQPPQTSSKPYKAVVYLLLNGGMDSFNLIVPHSFCSGTSFEQYQAVRGSVALSKSNLLKINAASSGQPCNIFGVHPQLPLLRDIYNDGELAFFANTGVLFEDVRGPCVANVDLP